MVEKELVKEETIKEIPAPKSKKESNKLDLKKLLDEIEKKGNPEEVSKMMELLNKLNELVESIESGKIDYLKGLKEFLINLETITNNPSEFLDEEKLLKMLDQKNSKEETVEELKNILTKILESYQNKENEDTSDKSIPYEEFNVKDIDELYQKLYEAITNNNIKKITYYRGKIISKLKRNKKKIERKYDEIKILHVIKKIMEEENNVTLEKIKDILALDKKYKNYFAPYMDSYQKFKKQFERYFEKANIIKIILYKEALNEELIAQRNDLKERYEDEFLDKKGTLTSTVTVLPNAVALSVKKLINTINELQEAKTNRKKIAKVTEAMGDAFRVLGTPVVYLGKFLLNNWYAMYMIHKSGIKIVPDKENEQLKVTKAEEPTQKVIVEKPKPNIIKPGANNKPNSNNSMLQNIDIPDNGTGTAHPEMVEKSTIRPKPNIIKPSANNNPNQNNSMLQNIDIPDNGTGTKIVENSSVNVKQEPTTIPAPEQIPEIVEEPTMDNDRTPTPSVSPEVDSQPQYETSPIEPIIEPQQADNKGIIVIPIPNSPGGAGLPVGPTNIVLDLTDILDWLNGKTDAGIGYTDDPNKIDLTHYHPGQNGNRKMVTK